VDDILASLPELQRAAFVVLLAVYWITEALLLSHMQAGQTDRIEDHGTTQLFQIVLPLSYVLAIIATKLSWAPMMASAGVWVGLALMVAGQLLRWWAVATLGRLFTVNVAIRPEHRVITSGPYRYVRHPAYTALVLLHLGAGLCLGNLVSLVLLTVPITLVLLRRIQVEEAAILAELGPAYRGYAARTWRLLPGIY